MSNLRLGLTLGPFCLEVEGDSNVTLELFREIRDSGLGKIASGLEQNIRWNHQGPVDSGAIIEGRPEATDGESRTTTTGPKAMWPPFNTVILQSRPSSQREWILISIVYATHFGEHPTNDEGIKSLLKDTKRLDDSMRSNYATNISRLGKGGRIEALAEGEYIVTEIGIDEALKIISREGKPAQKRKRATKSKAPNYQVLDLGLSEKEKSDFRKLWRSINPQSTIDKGLVIAGWLNREKGIKAITANHVFTMLRVAGESASFNLLAALKNGKRRHNYYESGEEPNTFSLIYLGEDRFNELAKDSSSQSSH